MWVFEDAAGWAKERGQMVGKICWACESCCLFLSNTLSSMALHILLKCLDARTILVMSGAFKIDPEMWAVKGRKNKTRVTFATELIIASVIWLIML